MNVEMMDLDLVLMLMVDDGDEEKQMKMMMVVEGMDKNMFAADVVHWDREILVVVA